MAANDTSFKPGQSGNPSGRKPDWLVRELAREWTEQAIQALAVALTDPRTAVPAAVALLDRGWGKAPQTLTGEDGAPLFPAITVIFGDDKPG